MIRTSIVAVAVAVAVPATALAHDHMNHDAAANPTATTAVSLDRYKIEISSTPAPLGAGRDNRVTVKVTDSTSDQPVSAAVVDVTLTGSADSATTVRATETAWAGSYNATVRPERAGPHVAHVIITAVHGRTLEEPLHAEVTIGAIGTGAFGHPMWWMLGLAGGIAVIGWYGARLKARTASGADSPIDLLVIPWVRTILTSRFWQPALQIPCLAVTAAIVYLGFTDVQNGGTNLATKLTWTIWWAGVIFTFVLAGRVWCLACPFGALNEWTSTLARSWRRLPKLFRNLWWATAAFIVLTWADEQLGIVRSPRVTSWIIVGFAALAIAIGSRYERRSFCRYLCPIGGLIGIYSMTAPVELRAKSAAVCRRHGDKLCYQGTASSPGCPMFEFAQPLDRNNNCTFCAACVTSCSKDNLALRFRAFGKDLWTTVRRSMDEAYLAAALVGITLLVTAQMLTAWPDWISTIARWLPSAVRSAFTPLTYLTALESIVLLGGSLVLVPALILGAAAVANRLAGEQRIGLRRTFVLFGYMFVPIGLAMHLAHNLSHLLLEGGGIVPVVQRAIALYTPWSIGEPEWAATAQAPESVVTLLQMTVLVLFFTLALKAGHRLSSKAYADAAIASRALIPFVVLALAFTAAGIVLLNLPMGMRHGM